MRLVVVTSLLLVLSAVGCEGENIAEPVAAPESKPSPPAQLPFSESFEAEANLALWTSTPGAQTDHQPESDVVWDSGAVRMTADAKTKNWMALTRVVKVKDTSWILLKARMRTQNVSARGARYQNNNLYIKHAKGVLGSSPMVGTNDWMEVRRRIKLPEETQAVEIGFFLSMPGTTWFDDISVEASEPPDWQESSTEHYNYLLLPGDSIPDKAKQYNEESYALVSKFLGSSTPKKVSYFKYPDNATIGELTGNAGNAYRKGSSIFSIWPSDRHEIVHVLADAWGDPPALVAEGLAVHLSGAWQNQTVRDYARNLIKEKRWIPLDAILTSAAFRGHNDLQTYAISGAFIEWVLAVHDKDTLKKLYATMKNGSDKDAHQRALQSVLKNTCAEVDAQLQAWLLK